MSGKRTAVFGIFHTEKQADRAVDDLIAAGFSNDDISLLLPDNQGSKEFAHVKHTKAPEGVTAGVVAGGAIGGTLSLMAAIGAITLPANVPFDVTPLMNAGAIISTFAGLGAGMSLGGLIGAVAGMGIPEYEAKRYEGRLKDGGVLLSVHCETQNEVDRSKTIMKHTGGHDISAVTEARADFPAASRQVSYR